MDTSLLRKLFDGLKEEQEQLARDICGLSGVARITQMEQFHFKCGEIQGLRRAGDYIMVLVEQLESGEDV